MKSIFTFSSVLFSLLCFTSKSQCNASFTYSVGGNGAVSFTSTSTGTTATTSYYWTFGDGSNYYAVGTPTASYTYAYNQVFNVSLSINDSINNMACMSTANQTLAVSNTSCVGTVAFTYSETINGFVFFYDNSTGISPQSTYTIYFGDGSTSNTSLNTSHTYSAAGAYNVTVAVTGPGAACNYTAAQTVLVNYVACPITAGFTYTVGSNGNVNFTNTTTGASSNANIYWNFGDGGGSILQNPSHAFTNSGVFNVNLFVSDSSQTACMDTITQPVTITGCFANVSFQMYKDSSQAPAIVWNAYTYYPQNMVSTTWSWGDGSTSSGLIPSHTYSAAGLYNICVTVSVACGATATACSNTNIFKMNSANSGPITLNVINSNAVGIKTNEIKLSELHIAPNPNNGEFELMVPEHSGEVQVEILDLQGRVVYKELLNETGKIKSEALGTGVYFLKVIAGENVYNAKMVVTKN